MSRSAFPDFDFCNALRTDASATIDALGDCLSGLASFNASGDSVPAPWDPPGDADMLPCDQASTTACTVLTPGDCLTP